jgi:hypothetical protein
LFARLRALAPPPPGTPAPLAVSGPGVVEGLLERAGLAVAGGAEVEVPFQLADGKPDGSLRQDNVFRYVLATK